MSKQYEKLKTLLMELFQLDQPDLDFGFYRIMHAKSAEVTQFLEKDLLPQVKSAFAQYQPADKAAIEKELAKAIEQARALGADPEALPKVKELRAKLADEAVDLEALEAEVYDHLYSFFRRYYSEGDFLSKRVYKPGVYAIPYEGEEVKLHWANADQYYIKTSEYLRDYAFRLRPDDDKNPMRVHFRLVDAAEGEHGNVKEQAGKERRFKLAPAPFAAVEDGELVIRFTYEPDPAKQKELNAAAEKEILGLADASLVDWMKALGAKHVRADGTASDSTRLRVHLDRYTARNTFDYFIHKDLGGFLRRELDFYIKNEVMHLDDVENESAPRVEQYLSKIKVIRRIAHKIIDFLAQLEDFQKKLWLKKKFVVDIQYCITLDQVFAIANEKARSWLVQEIIASDAQREEWARLFGIDNIKGDVVSPGYTVPLTVEFLRAQPRLVVDTAHFAPEFKWRLLASFEHLDAELDGTLVWADNFHGLNLIRAKHAGGVRCIYIDPPFNTAKDDFAYKDNYLHSSWMAMMADRLLLAKTLLSEDGTFYAHIDYNEKERLKLLLDEQLKYITEIIWRIGWISGYKSAANKFIRNHDTIYQYGKTDSPLFIKSYIPYPEGYTRRDGAPPSGQGYPLEDTWNCNDLDQLNSIQIMSFSREKVGNQALTQKNEKLLARMIQASSQEGDLILDYFLGSGTTAAVAHKLRRKWIGIEMGDWLRTYALPRMKKVLAGDPYGVSSDVGWTGGGFFGYVGLESYEDTLNNLELRRTKEQQDLLDLPQAQGEDKLKEQYMLRYMLDVETRGSQSLLNVSAFTDPTAYKLRVKRPGSDESREVKVDLLETFNWLIGLTVQHIAAPQTFATEFERDGEGRLRLKGRLKPDADGPWWFRTVTGTTPDGRKTLVVWRKRPGGDTAEGIEQDNLVLDEWFKAQKYSSKDSEFDLIYVNGDNNLENLKTPDDTWKVRLIEEDFFRLMFVTEGV